jgi:hypothetical protein
LAKGLETAQISRFDAKVAYGSAIEYAIALTAGLPG